MIEDLKKLAATYSPTFVVPSALAGLTSLFGMGRGEPCRYNHPKFLALRGVYFDIWKSIIDILCLNNSKTITNN